jgi:hypothetical protein
MARSRYKSTAHIVIDENGDPVVGFTKSVNSARSFIDRNPEMYGATIVAVDLYDNIEDYLEDANED